MDKSKCFIFLTNQYLPSPGATGLCIHYIARDLVNRGNTVFTVCYENEAMLSEIDGVNIIKIKTPPYINDSSSKQSQVFVRIASIWSKLVHITEYPLRSNTLVQRYFVAAEQLIKRFKHVTIIASFTPIEALIAAVRLKDKYSDALKIAYYSADTLSNEGGQAGILPESFRRRSGLRWECKLFDKFDKIFIMECHKEYYEKVVFSKYKSKFCYVNFPLIYRPNGTNKTKNNPLLLVYAGTLYRELRNPQYLLSCLNSIKDKFEFKAVFLGGGDCADIMRSAEQNSRKKILYLGMQPHNIAADYIRNADILLSIGNKNSPMAPSKIYEYMSTGKPIIHIFTDQSDPCIAPLERYGNALLIKESKEIPIEKIIEFMKNNEQLSFDVVRNKFINSTPDYTANLLLTI